MRHRAAVQSIGTYRLMRPNWDKHTQNPKCVPVLFLEQKMTHSPKKIQPQNQNVLSSSRASASPKKAKEERAYSSVPADMAKETTETALERLQGDAYWIMRSCPNYCKEQGKIAMGYWRHLQHSPGKSGSWAGQKKRGPKSSFAYFVGAFFTSLSMWRSLCLMFSFLCSDFIAAT